MSRVGIDLRLAGTHEGGIAEYARNLARWLPAIDGGREYLFFGRRGNTPSSLAPMALWTPPHHRLERLGLAIELLPYRLDLFHSPDFVPPLGGRFRRVITIQDLAFLTGGAPVPEETRRYYGRFIEAAVAEADAIIAISQATKRALIDAFGVSECRIRVTYLGRDERVRPRSHDEVCRRIARLGLEPGYLLSVASFEWRKNHDLLVEGYGLLRARHGDVPPLVLAGYAGPELSRVREKVRRQALENRVHVLVDLPASDLPFVYAGAGLFVLLSLDEGFGLPLVDAMGCGLPCLISARGALPEVAAGAALEVASMTAEEVSEALARLLEDSALRERLGRRALERSARYTWETTARATLAVYDELLGR